MKRFTAHLVVVGLLVCAGLARDCEWDQSIEEDQHLSNRDDDDEWLDLGLIREARDPEQCRAACCDNKDCDLALMGYPQDGEPQCTLVRCWIQNRDVCVLEPSTQFKVFKVKTGSRVDPELGSTEPKKNESNNSKSFQQVGLCLVTNNERTTWRQASRDLILTSDKHSDNLKQE